MFGSDEKVKVQDRPTEKTHLVEQRGASSDEPDEAYKKLQAERDALFERLARTQAEFDNYRKRSGREQADLRDYAVADVATLFLPVLDSFNLALASTSEPDSELRKGMELIRKQMEEALTKMGVKPIPTVGEPFDPRVHEAIEMVDSDEAGANRVVSELQRGYKIKDRLLRPARVRVAGNS